jgi:hypothetical protein
MIVNNPVENEPQVMVMHAEKTALARVLRQRASSEVFSDAGRESARAGPAL